MSITTTAATSTTLLDTAPISEAPGAASPSTPEPSLATQGHTPNAYIRPYNPEIDRPGIEAVFKEVYTPLYAFSGLTTIAFIVFCRAYLDLAPETCFVLATSDQPSRVLGYIVGAADSEAFCAAFAAGDGGCRAEIEDVPAAPTAWEMRDPELRKRCMEYFRQRNAWVSAISSGVEGVESIVFAGAKASLSQRYPAHFHAAVLPEARKRGFGRQLVGLLSERLGEMGLSGMYTAVPRGNDEAEKLYHRCGFEELAGLGPCRESDGRNDGETEVLDRGIVVKTLDASEFTAARSD